MNEQEEHRLHEINELKTKLSSQYLLNVDAQKELLELRELFESERNKVSKRLAAYSLLNIMMKLRRATIASSFRTWSTNTTLVGVALQFRSQVNDLMKDTLEEENKKKEFALQALRNQFQLEKELELKDLMNKCEHLIVNSKKESERERDRYVAEAKEDLQHQLNMELEQMQQTIDR